MVLDSVHSPARPSCATTELLQDVCLSLEALQCGDAPSVPSIRTRRNKKKRRPSSREVKTFSQLYEPTGQVLGEGSFGCVATYRSVVSGKLVAVKEIHIQDQRSRQKVLKEIDLYHACQGQDNILQLVEYFEEGDVFYMVLERMEGGALLEYIQSQGHMTEGEAATVVRGVATALSFLHSKGIAHRDLKPENILCDNPDQLTTVKLCDFDLSSSIIPNSDLDLMTPDLHSPVGSLEYMAPEVVDVWTDLATTYTKSCDLWSLGVIMYILLCGYTPFYADCGRDCGWESGNRCPACQDELFDAIQEGEFIFPTQHWSGVSDVAKDLVQCLLVREPSLRLTAEQVLQHPWLTGACSSDRELPTPSVLQQRSSTAQELNTYTQTANTLQHLLQCQLSITQVVQPPELTVGAVINEQAARAGA